MPSSGIKIVITSATGERLSEEDETSIDHSNPSIDTDSINSSNESIATSNISIGGFKSYKRRWYILFLCTAVGWFQGYFLNPFGPLYFYMQRYLHLHHVLLSLFLLYEPILLIILSVPAAYFLQKIRVRGLMMVMTMLMLCSTIIRCVPIKNHTLRIVLIHGSAIIVGIAGVPSYFLPTLISSRWYPPEERTLATAIGVSSFGIPLAYLIAPKNSSNNNVSLQTSMDQYHSYTYIETGVCLIQLIMVLVYYPSGPPTPVSNSALTPRLLFWHGCITLIKSKAFWLVSSPTYLIFSIIRFWKSTVTLDIHGPDISENQFGLIVVYGVLIGTAMSIISGKIGDLTGDLKALLIAHSCLAILSTVWLLLVIHQWITFSITEVLLKDGGRSVDNTSSAEVWYLATILRRPHVPLLISEVYIAGITAVACAFGLLPLTFELCVEMCFPVHEASVISVISVVLGLINGVLLGLQCFGNVGTFWMYYLFVVCCAISLPLLICIKPEHKRSRRDITD